MDKTLSILKRALEVNPADWETRRHLCELLIEAGQADEARTLISGAPAIPDNEDDRAFVRQLSEQARSEDAVSSAAEATPAVDSSIERADTKPETKPTAVARPMAPPAAAPNPLTSTSAGRAAIAQRYGRRKPIKRSRKVTAGTAEAADRTEKKKSHFAAFTIAGVLHGMLVLLFIVWVLTPGPISEPAVVLSAPPTDQLKPDLTKKSLLHSLKPDPSSSSSARAQVIAAAVSSPIAVPEVEVTEITEDVIGAGDTFGSGTGWGIGEGSGGGGTVRFFGQEQKAKRVCYIVDFSGSMAAETLTGTTRIDVLKKELIRSIKGLEPTTEFTLLFFAGGAWILGETPSDPDYLARVQADQTRTRAKWLTANAKEKSKVEEQIAKMPLADGQGTNWLPPLRASMDVLPNPDVIFLLTDGAAGDSGETIRTVTDIIPSHIPVNTVALELPGTTAGDLLQIAKKTGGDFSLHLDGNEYVGERAEKYTDPKYDPPTP